MCKTVVGLLTDGLQCAMGKIPLRTAVGVEILRIGEVSRDHHGFRIDGGYDAIYKLESTSVLHSVAKMLRVSHICTVQMHIHWSKRCGQPMKASTPYTDRCGLVLCIMCFVHTSTQTMQRCVHVDCTPLFKVFTYPTINTCNEYHCVPIR